MSKPSLPRRVLSGLWNGITRVRVALSNFLFLLVLFLLYLAFAGCAREPLREKAALKASLADVWDDDFDLDEEILAELDHNEEFFTTREERLLK